MPVNICDSTSFKLLELIYALEAEHIDLPIDLFRVCFKYPNTELYGFYFVCLDKFFNADKHQIERSIVLSELVNKISL